MRNENYVHELNALISHGIILMICNKWSWSWYKWLTSLCAAVEKGVRCLDSHCGECSIGDLCRTVSSPSISLDLMNIPKIHKNICFTIVENYLLGREMLYISKKRKEKNEPPLHFVSFAFESFDILFFPLLCSVVESHEQWKFHPWMTALSILGRVMPPLMLVHRDLYLSKSRRSCLVSLSKSNVK